MGGDYQGIRSLTEGSSAQRWVLAYICRDTEVPQLWWQQLWCHDSRWAVIEWDTMELGAKLRARTPLRGSSSSSSHQISSSAEKRTAASHSKTPACGVLIAWEEGPTGFLPAHLNSISEKKNTVLNGYLEGLLTQYFSANVAVT